MAAVTCARIRHLVMRHILEAILWRLDRRQMVITVIDALKGTSSEKESMLQRWDDQASKPSEGMTKICMEPLPPRH